MSQRSPVADPPCTLVEGQWLDQSTFHALYEAMPPGTRAELINGVVLMPSPVGPPHGRANLPTLMWLGFYQEEHPGCRDLGRHVDGAGTQERTSAGCSASYLGGVWRPDAD